MSKDSPVFLITGCSSGLGRELASGECFVYADRLDSNNIARTAALKRGFRVIATARRVETLDLLEQQGAKILSLDITSSEAELADFAADAIAI